ncbi:AAA family ATPase [Butyrivibrio sp. WCD2001]|uniref:AAA family ATPase n=1 Tax=Butyrivibrio sp. WCD2001 TaxID=1280681 RepID=UPI0004109C80|nr:AAA family ATPase [Butyrivibrio sp. WCD2001]
MIITIDNWGPIAHCEYDLSKRLIVTYGDNNIGKSYAMQVMYLLLKSVLSVEPYYKIMYLYGGQRDDIAQKIRKLVLSFADGSDQDVDITDDVTEISGEYLRELILPQFNESLRNSFGQYENLVDKNPIIRLSVNEGYFEIRLKDYIVNYKFTNKKICLKRTQSSYHKSRELKNEYDIYVVENTDGSKLTDSAARLVMDKIYESAHQFIKEITTQITEVHYLPASKAGLAIGMNSLGPIMAQLSRNRERFTKGFQISSIPEPFSDYYLELCSIESRKRGKYNDSAEAIENNILGGKVIFDAKTKELLYNRQGTDEKISMTDASSMVAEVSPLAAFFKYIVSGTAIKQDSKALIFIEEPEAHLHPRNQVKLARELVEIAKNGATLVVASHSNYMFYAYNNMVLGGSLSGEVYCPVLMRIIGNYSSAIKMPMDEFGVDDLNFIETADSLSEEREEYIIKAMEELDDKTN